MSIVLIQGNAKRIALADESVHCVVTSPPYWGLRDYGTATWEGGDPECDHKQTTARNDGGRVQVNGFHGSAKLDSDKGAMIYRDICRKCGAIRIDNQLGLEPTPEQYVANMVAVFREVWRVLRPDGTLWLNMGDSYATGHKTGTTDDEKGWTHGQISRGIQGRAGMPDGLKPKDLCGIPWRVAFALQADGWWLRSDIIWSKPNPMPESVTDRPTKAHEYLFLLTKSAKYYYDQDAVREQSKRAGEIPGGNYGKEDVAWNMSDGWAMGKVPANRNRRTVWHIATQPYSGSHFATFPEKLVEPCIKAGTSERGVCPECGAPWERVVDKAPETSEYYRLQDPRQTSGSSHRTTESGTVPHFDSPQTTTLGWRPTCDHSISNLRDIPLDPVPATVFDPFAGSGTTLQVARALGRNGVGLDLSLEYLHLARQRLSLDALEAWGKAKKDGAAVTDLPMFSTPMEDRDE